MTDRTVTELAIKTAALVIATTAAAAHLITLQSHSWSQPKKALWQLAWFVAVPTYSLALLLDRTYKVARLCFSKACPRLTLSYCIDAILGLHVEPIGEEEGVTIPLLDVSCEELREVTQPRNIQWFGRLFLLLCILTQSVGTIVLSVRRLQHFQMGETDIRNAWTAVGGTLVTSISIAIMLRNKRWEHAPIIQPGNSTNSTTRPSTQCKTRSQPGVIGRLIITLTVLNTWYFRYQIVETFERARSTWVPAQSPGSSSLPYGKAYGVWYLRNGYTARYVKSGLVLADFVWLLWPVMIFYVQQEHGEIVLLITFFHSLGFPIEEIARNAHNKWKDPIADLLYVF